MSENRVMAAGTDAGAGAGGRPGGVRRGAAMTVFRWALAGFLLLGAVQIFLAGLGVFGVFHGADDAFGPHRIVGFVMSGAAVVILVAALVARAGRAAVIWSAVLVAQTSLVQSLLAGLGDDHAAYGGLHALDGLAALGVAAWLWARSGPGARSRPAR
jgi:hypothetical protein